MSRSMCIWCEDIQVWFSRMIKRGMSFSQSKHLFLAWGPSVTTLSRDAQQCLVIIPHPLPPVSHLLSPTSCLILSQSSSRSTDFGSYCGERAYITIATINPEDMYKYSSRVHARLAPPCREPQHLVVITWRSWLVLDSGTWQPSVMVWISYFAPVLSYGCTYLAYLISVFCIYSLLVLQFDNNKCFNWFKLIKLS